MARETPNIRSFNAGELSDFIDNRSDLQKYFSGCRTLQNQVPLVSGAAVRMPGTKYVTSVKTAGKFTRLVPFNFSTIQAYILEFGDLYIRVYKNNQQIFTGASEGGELVTNGTFAAGTNWTDKDSGTGVSTITGGKLQLVCYFPGPTDFAGKDQGITTTAAATYKLTFDVIGSSVIVKIGTTSGGTDIYTGAFGNGTGQTLDFIAIGTTTYIGFYTTQATNQYVDNVICKNQVTPAPVEIVTTYTETELPDLKFAQSADVLYIVHPSHATAKLERTSHTAWTLTTITFIPPPSYEANTDISLTTATLTPGATTGTNVAFTASAAVWLAADVDRMIIYGSSRAIITAYGDTSHVHADILVAFSSTDPIAAGSWFLDGSPITEVSGTAAKLKVNAVTSLTTTAAAWRAADVGKYVHMHGGILEITSWTSTTVVKAKILSEISARTDTYEWTLEVADWTATRGYPSCIAFFEDRLTFACTTSRPQTVWRSLVGDYETFSRGTASDQSDEFTLISGLIDKINWISGHDSLIVGTAGGIWKLGGATTGEPLSLTSVSARKQVTLGVKDIMPAVVADALLWVSRSGRSLRQLIYQYDVDKWVAPDMTRLARHITKGSTDSLSGITEVVFQAEPFPILWAIRKDGQLLGMTYDTQEQVYAWFRVVTDGLFESMAVIGQNDSEDQVWVIVNRTIGGTTARYVEYFKPYEIFSNIEDSFYVHSGVTIEYSELVTNGSMELDSSWSSVGTPETNERSSTRSYAGTYSRRVDESSTSSTGIQQGISVTAACRYKLKAKVYLDKTTRTSGIAYVSIYDVQHTTTLMSTTITTGGEWVDVDIEATIPSGCTSVNLYFLSYNIASEFYVDAVSFKMVSNVVTGLTHLEAETVTILCDGVVLASEVVASGSVTIDDYGSKIHAGLPYDSIVEPMKLHAGSQLGIARTKKQRINKLGICFYETGEGVKAGHDANNLFDVQGLTVGVLTTDDLDFEFPLGWDDHSSVYIKQNHPVPMTILGIIPRISLNED